MLKHRYSFCRRASVNLRCTQMKKVLVVFSLLVLIAACKNSKTTDANGTADSVSVSKEVSTVEVHVDSASTWIDSFKDFRQALLDKDKVKLKTFFNFPLIGESASVFDVSGLTDAELEQRKKEVADPDVFNESDFDKYYNRLFDKRFLTALLKVKSAELYTKHDYSTTEFPDPETPYTLHASYDEKLHTLQLNMAFRYDVPHEDAIGESNVIYIFDVVDGKKLVFKTVVQAG